MLKRISGSAWSVLEYGWYPLLLLVTTPWFLHRLGADNYGYWMLLTAIVGLGGVLNTGTGAATIKAVSSRLGQGKSVERHIRSSLGIAAIGGGALSLLVIAVFQAGDGKLFGKMGGAEDLVQLTGYAAALLLLLEQMDIVASSALKGAERFANAAQLEVFGKSAQMLMAVAVAWRWPSLEALYLALTIGALVRLGMKLIAVKRVLALNSIAPSMRSAGDLLTLAKWGWLQGVGSVLFGVADRMIIGSMLGATSLAYYSIASQLAMQIHGISAAALSVMFPAVSRRFESPDGVSLWPVARLTAAGNILLSTTLAIALMLAFPWALPLWIGTTASEEVGNLLPWLAGAYWLLALNVVPFYILLGMGRMRFVGLTVLGAGLVGIATVWLTISAYGLAGSPAGRGAYALFSLALILPVIRHVKSELGSEQSQKRGHLREDSRINLSPPP